MKRESPSSFRLTSEQLELLSRRSAKTGIPRNRIVRWAIDSYFQGDLDAA